MFKTDGGFIDSTSMSCLSLAVGFEQISIDVVTGSFEFDQDEFEPVFFLIPI